ncbi:MAG TPA: hypothetical protein DIV86_02775 [Alphaproteobacteria bacterium]|nr:hypothetical protein [Alphaproteobacteria bacterium]
MLKQIGLQKQNQNARPLQPGRQILSREDRVFIVIRDNDPKDWRIIGDYAVKHKTGASGVKTDDLEIFDITPEIYKTDGSGRILRDKQTLEPILKEEGNFTIKGTVGADGIKRYSVMVGEKEYKGEDNTRLQIVIAPYNYDKNSRSLDRNARGGSLLHYDVQDLGSQIELSNNKAVNNLGEFPIKPILISNPNDKLDNSLLSNGDDNIFRPSDPNAHELGKLVKKIFEREDAGKNTNKLNKLVEEYELQFSEAEVKALREFYNQNKSILSSSKEAFKEFSTMALNYGLTLEAVTEEVKVIQKVTTGWNVENKNEDIKRN